MAGKALVAFSLLAILLQVRAQISCYHTFDCDETERFEAPSVRECCVEGGVPMERSHSALNDPSTCHLCVVFNISDQSVNESERTVTLNVSLSVGTLDQSVDLSYETREVDPGTSDVDYEAATGTLTFQSGVKFTTFTIGITEDTLVEVNETFEVHLEPPNENVVIFHDTATVTIIDDDGVLTLYFYADTFISESKGRYEYELHGDRAWGSPMDLHVFTLSGETNGFAQEGEDYEPINKTVTLMPGESLVRYFEANLVDDIYYEKTYEKFYILVGVPEHFSSKIIIGNRNRSTVTINDNDDLDIGFEYVVYSVGEGDGSLEFKVESKNNVQIQVPVRFSLLDHEGSALRGQDYTVGDNELQLLPGEPNIYRVMIIDDDATESNETFTLSMDTSHTRVDVHSGFNRTMVTIIDNDVLEIELRTELTSVDEGRVPPVSVSVNAIGFLPAPVILTVSSVPHNKDHYATEDDDYIGFSDTLTLMPGVNPSNSTTVTILDDQVFELYREVFEIQMKLAPQSPFKRVSLISTPRNVTILDNDELEIGFKAVSYNIEEGDGFFTFDVEVKNDASFVVPIEYALNDIAGEARRTEDYVVMETPVRRLDPGHMSVQHTVEIKDDNVTEIHNETFTLDLSSRTERVRASPLSAQLTATITDDDVLTIDFDELAIKVSEDAGTVKVCMSIVEGTLAEDKDVTVVFQTVSGTASAPDDYESIDQMPITLTKDDPSACVDVTIKPDYGSGQNKTFLVTMTSDDPLVDLDSDEIEITMENVAIPPGVTIGFDQTEYHATESNAANPVTQEVCMRILKGSIDIGHSVIVRLESIDETATKLEDYELVPEGSVTLTNQTTSHCLNVVINGDELFEAHETFSLKLTTSNSSVALDPSETRITIMNDDVVNLTMKATEAGVSESKNITIEVTPTRYVDTHIIVRLFSAQGDREPFATVGEDYIGLDKNVSLRLGSEPTFLDTFLIDDTQLEPQNEYYLIKMEVPKQPMSDMIRVGKAEDEVSILDNEILNVFVGFKKVSYTVGEGSGNVVVEVELKHGFTTAIEFPVTLIVTEGSARNITDFIGWETVILKFNPFDEIVQHSIAIVSDNTTEEDEKFTLSLRRRHQRIFIDPDSSQADVTITEAVRATVGFEHTTYTVSENASHANVCVRILDGTVASDKNITVMLQSVDGTATASSDYTAVDQPIELSAQNMVSCVNIEIKQDPTFETDETFKLTLTSNLPNVTVDPSETEITIKDDDGATVGFDHATYTVSESASHANVCLSILDGTLSSDKSITVMIQSVDGTATAPSDYTAIDQTIVLTAQNKVSCVDIEIKQDPTFETDETFKLRLTSATSNVTVDPAETEITIQDDDGATVGFDHATYTVSEGASHANVCLSILDGTLASDKSIMVMVLSVDETATAPSDYTAVDQTIVLTAQNMVSCVNVEIKQDPTLETDETFKLTLTSNLPTVILNPAETEITIQNDDEVMVSFKAASYTFQESSELATVTVVFTGDTAVTVTVNIVGVQSTQTTIGDDRLSFFTQIEFNGSGPLEEDVTETIADDEIALEEDERVDVDIVVVGPTTGVTIGSPTTVIIIDDDLLSASFSKSREKVGEGDGMVEVCVNKSLKTIPDLKFGLQSRDGSATDGSDYIGFENSTITIAGNDNTSCLSVKLINDTKFEDTEENFFVDLSYLEPPAGSSLTLDLIETEIIIVDDDGVRVSFKSDSYTYNEDDGQAHVVVVLTGETTRDVVVSVQGGPSTQINIGPDRVVFNETSLTFTADGPKEKTVSADIANDDIALEDDELVTVELDIVSPTTGANLGRLQTTLVTIVDDDALVVELEKSKDEVGESDGIAEICLRKSHVTIPDLVFDLHSRDGSATAGSDYIGLTNSKIDVANNTQRGCLSVDIINDNQLEHLEENFFVDLSYSGSHKVTVEQNKTEITIIDNDDVKVGFESPQYIYIESNGQAYVVVVLTGDTDLDVVVSIAGGPSTQTNIGTDKVEFNSMVTFTPGGPKKHNVSATITNDEIALEDREIVDVALRIMSPLSRVKFDDHPTTKVTIVDDDSLTVSFTKSKAEVTESDGTVDVCVQKSHHTISDVRLNMSSHDGNATEGADYNLVRSLIIIPKLELQGCYPIVEILNDTQREGTENFYVTLFYPGKAPVSLVPPSSIEFLIEDLTPLHTCNLCQHLILHPFSQDMPSNNSFSMSQGCEHTLVKTCEGSSVALDIRVDFFQHNFSSTEVAISFEGERVIIKEDLTLDYKTHLSRIVIQSNVNNIVVVSIPEIELKVTRTSADLTITLSKDDLQLSGLCGTLDEELVFPNCSTTLDTKKQLRSFIRSYKIKPSDLILREERKECGVTATDTVIHDPVMTVPVNAPEIGSDIYLCYEIHGDADKYFNLVSDDCTTVNAHYSQVESATRMNIIDSISIVAVDNQDQCHQISVNVDGCLATVDGMVLDQMSERRSISTYDANGISIRSYSSRARISVPNCADNSLVMWVICENTTIFDTYSGEYTDYTNMIKFEITRGLNLHEYSHGLLGQFWNIPVTIKLYTTIADEDYYNVTVSHPSSKPRSFSGLMYFLTWDYKEKQCLYVGNEQGGHSPEVPELRGSVIEGFYLDYVVDGAFDTQFSYTVFEKECASIA